MSKATSFKKVEPKERKQGSLSKVAKKIEVEKQPITRKNLLILTTLISLVWVLLTLTLLFREKEQYTGKTVVVMREVKLNK